MDVDREITE